MYSTSSSSTRRPNKLTHLPTMATAGTSQALATTPASHAPSLAGSVIEASDGLGGSVLIRIQNMSCTGKRVSCVDILHYYLLPF